MSAGPKTLLVVEDDEDIREALRDVLEASGYGVTLAANGRDALEQLDGARPALVILDLMMPVMDGFAFMRALRARPDALASTPVVLVTAAGRAAVNDIDVQHVIAKPIDIKVLLAVIAKHARG